MYKTMMSHCCYSANGNVSCCTQIGVLPTSIPICYDARLFSLVYFSIILTSHHVMSHMTHDVMEVLGRRHPASTPSQTVPYAPAFRLHHSPLLHIPITAHDFRTPADDSL